MTSKLVRHKYYKTFLIVSLVFMIIAAILVIAAFISPSWTQIDASVWTNKLITQNTCKSTNFPPNSLDKCFFPFTMNSITYNDCIIFGSEFICSKSCTLTNPSTEGIKCPLGRAATIDMMRSFVDESNNAYYEATQVLIIIFFIIFLAVIVALIVETCCLYKNSLRNVIIILMGIAIIIGAIIILVSLLKVKGTIEGWGFWIFIGALVFLILALMFYLLAHFLTFCQRQCKCTNQNTSSGRISPQPTAHQISHSKEVIHHNPHHFHRNPELIFVEPHKLDQRSGTDNDRGFIQDGIYYTYHKPHSSRNHKTEKY